MEDIRIIKKDEVVLKRYRFDELAMYENTVRIQAAKIDELLTVIRELKKNK